MVVHLRDRVPARVVAAGRGAGRLVDPVPSEVRLVVVGVPPVAIAEVVARCLDRYPNAAITDVGSVKARIAGDLARLNLNLGRYVGGHPMAGSHRSGPVTAVSEPR